MLRIGVPYAFAASYSIEARKVVGLSTGLPTEDFLIALYVDGAFSPLSRLASQS